MDSISSWFPPSNLCRLRYPTFFLLALVLLSPIQLYQLLLATSFIFFTLFCRFNFLMCLFYVGTFPFLGTVFFVVFEHPRNSTFLAAVTCTVLSCFANFVSPSHNFLRISALVRSHSLSATSSVLVSKRESVRIAFILPACALAYYFWLCAPQEHHYGISMPRYIYWSSIGSLVLPFECCWALVVFVRYSYCALFLNYHSPFSSVFIALALFFVVLRIIPTQPSANINPDTILSPTVTLCVAASTTIIMSLIYTLNGWGDNVNPCATPCNIST